MTINPKNFGLSGGIILGFFLFAVAWEVILTNMGYEFVKIWEDMHFWYGFVSLATPAGSLVALIDGFIHGFVSLFILSYLYNWFEKRTR